MFTDFFLDSFYQMHKRQLVLKAFCVEIDKNDY